MTGSARLIADGGRHILRHGGTFNGKGGHAGRGNDENARENSLQ
jgi:hypothetical protein